LTPPIQNYKSPDGDYVDTTKQWVQPELHLLNKKFGVGKLIKTPTFQKKIVENKKEDENKKKVATG
jgi:hypothetical protein